MKFEPTSYQLMNVGTGRLFEDGEWTLADPQARLFLHRPIPIAL